MVSWKIISIILALITLITISILGFTEDILLFVVYILISLALIWYGDELGKITGVTFSDIFAPKVSQTSPGGAVKFMGWILLITPIIGIIIKGIRKL